MMKWNDFMQGNETRQQFIHRQFLERASESDLDVLIPVSVRIN